MATWSASAPASVTPSGSSLPDLGGQMAFDDDSGWTEILVSGWGPLVRAAVVDRVERGLVGRRGVLCRAVTEEAASAGHAACVEQVHALVVAGIRVETGADIDELGSQAAWACYDEVWGQLQDRWGDGGRTVPVPHAVVDEVTALVRSLSPAAAEHAGADIGEVPFRPLHVGARVHVDVEGLFAHLALDTGEVTAGDRVLIDRLIGLVRGRLG